MDVNFLGHIDGIRYLESSVVVTASEVRNGYRKKDGAYVDDEVYTFKFLFKNYFKKYISSHFSEHMLVKIKGTMIPYVKDGEGNVKDGYTILAQTIDVASYQRLSVKKEKKMVTNSQRIDDESPNLSDFKREDF